MTRVSIVTPFLDAEAHLREAIDSVIAQTVRDWELLLIDDGSTDASPAIAAAAAQEEAGIRLVAQAPGAPHGAAAARNAGIAAATGTYLAFLDADDLLEPQMLATTLAAAERYPNAALIWGPTHWWHPGDPTRDWVESTDGRGGLLHQPPRLLRSLILLQQGQVPCTCSVLARRAAVVAVGGFDVRFRLYEDQTLWVKLLRGHPAFVTSVPLSRYRQHAASVSAQAAQAGEYDYMKAHSARLVFLDWVEEYLRAEGALDPGLARTLRLVRAPYRCGGGLRGWIDRRTFSLHRRLWRLRSRLRRRLGREPRLPAQSLRNSERARRG